MQKSQAPNASNSGGASMNRAMRPSRRHGSVWLVPTAPKEATTTLTSQLPQIVGALALDGETELEVAGVATPAPECVLIVEDDPHVAGLLRSALELEGRANWAIDIRADGRAALIQAQQTAPSIVLLDARLPDMDGAEVYHRLRATPGSEACPVVFLTASTSVELSLRGVDGGVLLRKPFDVDQVIALVTALLQVR